MKKSLIAFALFAAMLLLAGCAVKQLSTEDGGYQLYFLSGNADGGEDAIVAENVQIKDDATLDVEELAQSLLTALLNGPSDDKCISPFPSGTQVNSLTISGKCAQVDFSGSYARLSGVDLSLADYCVTLTLTQSDGINAVHITANGKELPYRKTQLLTAADALLASRETGLRPITVSLYFYDAELGELRAQQQTIALYEGQQRVNALLDTMLLGPEEDESLTSLLPEGFYILSSHIDDGVCYLNLPSDGPLPESQENQKLMFEALEKSLCSLSGVEQVQFLLDGESVETIGTVTLKSLQIENEE